MQINGALASLSLRCIVSLLSFGPGDDSPFYKNLPSRAHRFLDFSAVKQREGFGVASQVRLSLRWFSCTDFNLFSGEYAWHTRHHRPFVAPEPGHTEHAAAPPKHRTGATRAIINEYPATAASPSPSPHSPPPLSFRSTTSAGLRLLVLLGLTMPSQIQCSCAPAVNLFLSLSFPFVS